MNLNVQTMPITRLSSDGNTANEGVKNVDLVQAKVSFSGLPQSAEDIASADRSDANGKFVTMALAIASFACWTPETRRIVMPCWLSCSIRPPAASPSTTSENSLLRIA